MANSVTLHDVAKLAGVSIGTASQALNNRPSVAQETRVRVLGAARTLGYPFKETDNGTGENPLSIIGLLTKHDYGFPFEVNAFYSYIQAGVESECTNSSKFSLTIFLLLSKKNSGSCILLFFYKNTKTRKKKKEFCSIEIFDRFIR